MHATIFSYFHFKKKENVSPYSFPFILQLCTIWSVTYNPNYVSKTRRKCEKGQKVRILLLVKCKANKIPRNFILCSDGIMWNLVCLEFLSEWIKPAVITVQNGPRHIYILFHLPLFSLTDLWQGTSWVSSVSRWLRAGGRYWPPSVRIVHVFCFMSSWLRQTDVGFASAPLDISKGCH